MTHPSLEAWARPTSKTSGATKVRNEGYIPGILLGHKEPAVTLKVKSGDMTRVLKAGGSSAIVDLSIDGRKEFAMVREFTRDPVSRRIIHVDFQRVSMNEIIESPVQVVVAGEPASEYSDYIVTMEVTSVRVKAVPDAIPHRIEVDAASLQPTQPLTAADLPLPEGVQMAEDPAFIIAVLAPPSVTVAADEAAPAEEPAAAAEEPAAE
jgi:large subunit ribosomal protein L25